MEEFHSIISDFEAATDNDFSTFRIRDSELSVDAYRPTTSYYEPPAAGLKYCDRSIFRARVSGLVRYVIALTQIHSGHIPDEPPKKASATKVPSSSIYIENMHSSQLIAHSHNASMKNNFNPKDKEFRELIALIKETIPKLTLDPTAKTQIEADLATVEAQIESPAPKYRVIGESPSSTRSILESVAGNVLTNALFMGMAKYLS